MNKQQIIAMADALAADIRANKFDCAIERAQEIAQLLSSSDILEWMTRFQFGQLETHMIANGYLPEDSAPFDDDCPEYCKWCETELEYRAYNPPHGELRAFLICDNCKRVWEI